MEKTGRLEIHTLEGCLDEALGPVGTPKLEHGCNASIATVGRVLRALGVRSGVLDLGACGELAL